MSDERWDRMWSLFHDALEKSPEERAGFLHRSCGDDAALRAKIDRLLEAHDDRSGVLDQPAAPEAIDHAELDDPLIGERIGPYLISDVIGEGGMGVVYAADQEERVRRRVALKLIRPGMDSREVVNRFEAERQALALMNHPNIAGVLDGGATDAGRPYFVMEHVDGVPITEYCDRRRLDTTERLELFLQVCDGVGHAHQKGIIHRDLKPSNILVATRDGRPVPKIIDFGVAKATEQRLTERTMFTAMGVWVGTPEYMSPEQADLTARDVDTRTDVYALGVLLYELLAGALPFDAAELREAGFDEIRRKIREDEPSRPSTRLATLAGDLDWITMRALEKDRERRYGSVAEFAADVGRHLRDEPVQAGPPGAAYRFGKFVRRHRVGVGFAGLLLVVLVGFAVTMAVLAGRIARERDRADLEAERAGREAETARQVSDFLVGLFRVSRPTESRGNTVTAREILDRGAGKIREDLHDQPLVQARLMETIGIVYRHLGLYEPSLGLLQEALEVRTKAFGENSLEVAESLGEVGATMERMADYDAARLNLERSLEIQRESLGPDAVDVGTTVSRLSRVHHGLGDYAEAQAMAEEAAAIYESVYGPEHRSVARELSWAAQMLGIQGRFEEALERALRALALGEAARGADNPALAGDVNGVAVLYWQLRRYEEARPYFERAYRMWEDSLGPKHPFTAAGANNLGRLLTDMEEYEEARRHLERSLEIRMEIFGPDHSETAVSVLNLGRLLNLMGDTETALELYEQGLAVREQRLGPDHPLVAMALEGYAVVLRSAGDEARAVELEARARSIREETGTPPQQKR